MAGRPVVRGHKLLTVDEAKLAAEAAEISPGFRKEVEALRPSLPPETSAEIWGAGAGLLHTAWWRWKGYRWIHW